MELFLFLGSLFAFLFVGIPISMVLVLRSIVLMWHSGMWDSMIIPSTMLDGANNYPLMAIPFFVFAGEIMAEGGLSKRVVQLAQLMIGRVRGGLGYAAIISSVIFAGLMGSSVGEAAALGGLLLPMMAEVGYKPGRAGGVIASGAILGPIIPPSTNFILLGATISGLSITKLFMIGLFPGIFIGLALMVVWFFIVRIDGYNETITFTREEKWKIIRDATPAFMMPVLLLGGIRFGVFTPTEAAAVAVFYGLFVGVFIYRTINSISILVEIFAASIRATAVVMLVVTCAGLFSWVASTVGLVEKGSAVLLAVSDNQWVVLLMINIILLLAGMLLDAISIYYVFLPFMLPIMAHFNWDPVWFGIMMTVNLAVGQVTPPVAVNLYVGANISGISMERISKAALPLIFASLLALVVIIIFPDLSTFVPRMLGQM